MGAARNFGKMSVVEAQDREGMEVSDRVYTLILGHVTELGASQYID